MEEKSRIDAEIKAAEKQLAVLDQERAVLMETIQRLKHINRSVSSKQSGTLQSLPDKVTNESPENKKISLFRALFRGREDVFPKRFESTKSGKTGYQPECRNQWIKGLCRKPAIKCANCDVRDFTPPLSDNYNSTSKRKKAETCTDH